MVAVSRSDLERILAVVQTLGEVSDPEEFARITVRELAALVPADAIALNEVDPAATRVRYVVEPTSFSVPRELETALIDLAGEHPLINYYATTNDGSAKMISDFWTQNEFHASEVYRRIYRHMGVEYQVSLALPAPRPVVVAAVGFRSTSDFTERDRTVLNTLRPHLLQAWYNARDQRQLRTLLGAAAHAATDSGAALLVLSDPPHEVTPGALVTLYRHFGRPTRTSPLPERVERWVAAQRARLAEPGSLNLIRPLRESGSNGRMVLRYLSAQDEHPGALLLREQVPGPDEARLIRLGLSTREAEVVRGVIAGQPNRVIAENLHLSSATVKKHLENIYAKLGVRGRVRLTAFALDMVDR